MTIHNSFYAIVETNEHIKQVVNESRQLYLTGLNAMFLSRDANQHANGYATVTKELRNFSNLLIQDMTQLKKGVFELLQHIVHYNKTRRIASLVVRAYALAGCQEDLSHARAEAMASGECYRDALRRLSEHLTDRMEEMRRMCHLGEQIALHAKVEATTIHSARSVALEDVAVEISQNVNIIREILGQGVACLATMNEMAAREWDARRLPADAP